MSATIVEIVVQGTFGDTLDNLLPGFGVDRVENGCTHLIGPVLDQSRLQGILIVLSNLNIALVSVNPIG
jgi:hypothetical protein